MLQIMIACRRTGQFVAAGIETDIDIFYRVAGGVVSNPMPRMRRQSLLDNKPDLDLQY
jgi:hypothetical protein